VTSKPRSAAARAAASTHMWVCIPQITSFVTPSFPRTAARSVSRKALALCLQITVSPGSGARPRGSGIAGPRSRGSRGLVLRQVLDVDHGPVPGAKAVEEGKGVPAGLDRPDQHQPAALEVEFWMSITSNAVVGAFIGCLLSRRRPCRRGGRQRQYADHGAGLRTGHACF